MKTALFSVYEDDKPSMLELARALHNNGWSLLGSRGSAAYLNENGVPATDIAKFVGPPILGHKVVTLSREIHAALLADESPEEQAELDRIGIPRIDLVFITLYPLEKEVASENRTLESIRAKTDIGGPCMLRSAAKGCRWVISNQGQVEWILNCLRKQELEKYDYIKVQFAAAAEARTSEYCQISSDGLFLFS